MKKKTIKKTICPFCKKPKIAGSICSCEVNRTGMAHMEWLWK